MTLEYISWSNLGKRMLPIQRELNSQPPDQQSDVHPTEPPRPALVHLIHYVNTELISLPNCTFPVATFKATSISVAYKILIFLRK